MVYMYFSSKSYRCTSKSIGYIIKRFACVYVELGSKQTTQVLLTILEHADRWLRKYLWMTLNVLVITFPAQKMVVMITCETLCSVYPY